MPIPAVELALWRGARVRHGDEVLPPLPLSLQPTAWVISACAPAGEPSADDANRHAMFLKSLAQAKAVFREVDLDLGQRQQPAVLVQGIGRARAVKLGYKRKQWAVLGFEGDRVHVVYTGLNSRMR